METMNVNQAISQQVFQILTKASLENLNAGDILKGRIQSIENGMLLIKLLDGLSFTAAAPEDFYADAGDSITLEIGERQNNQITAKILNNETAIESGANKESVLASAIKSNLESFGLARPENLVSNVLDLLKAEPQLTPNQASFLVANNLYHDPKMNELLQKISEHEFNLHNNLQSLQNGISEEIAKMDGDKLIKLLKPILVSQELDDLSSNVKGFLAESSPKLVDSIMQNINSLLTKILLDETTGQGNENGENLINKEIFETLIKSSSLNLENEALTLEKDKNAFQISTQTQDNILKLLNKALKDIYVKSERMNKGERDQSLIKEIKAVLEKLFDKAFIKVENGVVKGMNIEEKTKALKDIMEFSQKVINSMDRSSKESNLPAFNEINTAFKFFEQVTTYNSMLQLPIKVNQQNTTGELYVMRRKNGRRKIDTENFTLFLSLTTNSIGLVESFLNATNKHITISFRVEEKELVKLFKDNYRSLYDGLLEKGFTLVDMKCRLLDGDRVDVLNVGTKVDEVLGIQNRLDLKI